MDPTSVFRKLVMLLLRKASPTAGVVLAVDVGDDNTAAAVFEVTKSNVVRLQKTADTVASAVTQSNDGALQPSDPDADGAATHFVHELGSNRSITVRGESVAITDAIASLVQVAIRRRNNTSGMSSARVGVPPTTLVVTYPPGYAKQNQGTLYRVLKYQRSGSKWASRIARALDRFGSAAPPLRVIHLLTFVARTIPALLAQPVRIWRWLAWINGNAPSGLASPYPEDFTAYWKAIHRVIRKVPIRQVGALSEAQAIAWYVKLPRLWDRTSVIGVFDFGAGSTGISLLQANRSGYSEITGVTTKLISGYLLDRLTADHLIDLAKASVDPGRIDDLPLADSQEMRVLARSCREALSTVDSFVTELDMHGGVIQVTATRDELESKFKRLVDSAIDALADMLAAQSRPLASLILTGGVSRTPYIRAALETKFAGIKLEHVPEKKNVALGAAIWGGHQVEPTQEDDETEEQSGVLDGLESMAGQSPTGVGAIASAVVSVVAATGIAAAAVAVLVDDPQLSKIFTPQPFTVEASDSQGSIVIYQQPDWRLSPGGTIQFTCLPTSNSQFPIGDTLVECFPESPSDRVSTVTFMITVADRSPPSFPVKNNIVISAQDPSGAEAHYEIPAAEDSVDGRVIPVCSPLSGDLMPLGQTTVSCVATDSSGNQSQAHEFQVLVEDTTPPTLTPVLVPSTEATGRSGAVVNYTLPQAIDQVDQSITAVCSPAPGSLFPVGTSQAICIATDSSGNTSDELLISILVEDTTAPALDSIVVDPTEATGPEGALVDYRQPDAADLVDSSPAIDCRPAQLNRFPLGSTTVRCTAVDNAGNQSREVEVVILVEDTTPPTLTPTVFQVFEADFIGGAIVSYPLPKAADAVDLNLIVDCGPAPDNLFPIGVTTVRCTAQDFSMNTSDPIDIQIRVADRTPPEFVTALPNLEIIAVTSDGVEVNWPLPSAVDRADASPTVECFPSPGSTIPIGSNVVRCTANDFSENEVELTFNIEVSAGEVLFDSLEPWVQEAVKPGLNTVDYVIPTATDSLGRAALVTCSPLPGSGFFVGESKDVICDAEGVTGAKISGVLPVMVVDTTPPEIFSPAGLATQEAQGPLGTPYDFPMPTAIDLADPDPAVSCHLATSHLFDVGLTVVRCEAVDSEGNLSKTLLIDILVEDTTPPMFTSTLTNITIVTSDLTGAIVNYPTPSAADTVDHFSQVACSPLSASFFPVSPDVGTTVECTAKDDYENSTIESFQVFVKYEPGILAFAGQHYLEDSDVPDGIYNNNRFSIRVDFGQTIDASSVSVTDFEVKIDEASFALVSVEVRDTDVFLRLGSPMFSDAEPVVALISPVSFANGTNVDLFTIKAIDKIAPSITVALSDGSGFGESPYDSTNYTNNTMTITVQSDVPLNGLPTIQVFAPGSSADPEQSPIAVPTSELLTWSAVFVFGGGFADGTRRVVVSAQDTSSSVNVRIERNSTFIVDTKPPSAEFSITGGGAPTFDTPDNQPFIVMDYGFDNVKIWELQLDGVNVLGQQVGTTDRSFTFRPQFPLGTGPHSLKVNTSDFAVNFGSTQTMKFTIRPLEGEFINLDLAVGWNSVSIPRTPVDQSIDSVFSNTGISQVVAYDATTPSSPWSFASKIGAGPYFGTISTVSAGVGYWVLSSDGEDQLISLTDLIIPTPISLGTGWNFIGVVGSPASVGYDIGPYLDGIVANLTGAVIYDPTSDISMKYLDPSSTFEGIASISDFAGGTIDPETGGPILLSVLPGKAYWVYLRQADTLTIP